MEEKIKKHFTKAWRDFEELVARIEALYLPTGAIVKSPDRIPDKDTGRLREVDVSIRMTVGSTVILILTSTSRNRPVSLSGILSGDFTIAPVGRYNASILATNSSKSRQALVKCFFIFSSIIKKTRKDA